MLSGYDGVIILRLFTVFFMFSHTHTLSLGPKIDGQLINVITIRLGKLSSADSRLAGDYGQSFVTVDTATMMERQERERGSVLLSAFLRTTRKGRRGIKTAQKKT